MRAARLFFVCILGASLARAETRCPAPAGTSTLSAVDAQARLQFVREALRTERPRLLAWSRGWGSVTAVAGAVQIVAASLVKDPGARVDLIFGSSSAVLGATLEWVLPLGLTNRLQDAQVDIDGDVCASLALAEAALVEGARYESVAHGWMAHLGNVLINTVLSLALGIGFGRWESAVYSSGIGLVVGAAKILTHPAGLLSALERYRAGDLEPWRPPEAGVPVTFSTGGAQLGFRLTF
ncbi:MAG: hypothetical protein ACKVPX_01080 [Myxococcaceae bacterium]